MPHAAVPNETCKQGWGLSSRERLKPINLTLLGHPNGWPEEEDSYFRTCPC